MKGTLEERFWPKVQKTSGCWQWLGSKLKSGYGYIAQFPRRKKNLLAHRASWIIHFGTIPDGLFVLHRCDNPECTRPDHLFLGTLKDNSQDSVIKGRAKHGEHTGSANSQAKLTEQNVRDIRDLVTQGVAQTALAKQFNTPYVTINHVVRRYTWKHVP